MRIPALPRAAASSVLLAGAVAIAPGFAQSIVPAPLPNLGIAGFHFPESDAVLAAQVGVMTDGATAADRAGATDAIRAHAWGLWAALTSFSSQIYERQELRIFETWTSVDELLPAPDGQVAAGSADRATEPPVARSSPRRISVLRFTAHAPIAAEPGDTELGAGRITGTVKLNPAAAEHIRNGQLLSATVLQALLDDGAGQIPRFPNEALIAKPIYRVITRSDLVGGRYYLLKVWTGPPSIPQAWGPDQWSSGVWVDLGGEGAGAGEVDATASSDGSSRTDATTYPVSTFIHHELSATDAAAFNDVVPGSAASAGDTVLLVAMHVATRELPRWTWQTFWWTPDPETPPLPSSRDAAGARPPQLQGAARHYAMALAYSMLTSEQPSLTATNTGPAVYAYNPYVEARFGPGDLPDSRPGFGPDGQPAPNNVGVQSNCLSCHAQATFHALGLESAPRFTGARYVDPNDPQFAGTLPTEFLWILPRHAR